MSDAEAALLLASSCAAEAEPEAEAEAEEAEEAEAEASALEPAGAAAASRAHRPGSKQQQQGFTWLLTVTGDYASQAPELFKGIHFFCRYSSVRASSRVRPGVFGS